jgi:threonyl-tRNA synthetase
VIGPRETAADEIALRLRDGRRLAPQPATEALDRISRLVRAHSTELIG